MSKPLNRRQFLEGAGSGALLLSLAGPGAAQAPTGAASFNIPALMDGQRFDPAVVVDVARLLAQRPMIALNANDLPEGYASLPADQYAAIRMQPGATVWAGENRGFTVEPLHRGHIFSNPVSLFTIEEGTVRRIGFDRGKFDYGRVAPPPANLDLQFSGMRITAGLERPFEVAVFQGGTFFRALARGQNFGAMARALILRPGETRGEELPFFRAFWIERPSPAVGSLVIHGLLDSESVVGAVRMTLRPGDVTFVDVEMTLFARQALDHVGFGCASATFLSGPQSRRVFDDIRPSIGEVSGVQMRSGAGEWIYRPVNNPATLQVSSFVDENPKGFGLVQRERDPAAFQDDEQRFELRPSIWIEPLGDWGAGSVQLIEIPSDSEPNKNIIMYWRPKQPLAAGSETALSYRQAWCWQPPERPELAIAVRSRQGKGSQGRRRRFIVDFTGERLADPALVAATRATITAQPGAVHGIRLWSYPERKLMRVGFEVDPGNENLSELRLVLRAGEEPVSETWLNRWTW
ncbi:glucan biosynthesis protein [Bosea sp. (in: a-proteobacteria)]|uniref:glucan biosynthesis protein n=1 Tax=Bosea sp. (in: a-proteobacteria) TaxID=1871050 RepID=UPI002635996E|nr:glucan biosynthesis protein [Bosea sp. (in: a-proteobacteria)]MCO5093333.1 glucan biosynthesis protein [Bosea sp. (in: a-proteobacteria)]